eukprot:1177982-Prorocentrum_minimum.AAC.1
MRVAGTDRKIVSTYEPLGLWGVERILAVIGTGGPPRFRPGYTETGEGYETPGKPPVASTPVASRVGGNIR